MVLDRALKELILEGASVDQLHDFALASGMKTLIEYGLELVGMA